MDNVLTRQGPLAHVWLAANYDKKLSKHQLLGADLVRTSELIMNQRIHQLQTTNEDNAEGMNGAAITLRVSGHLILGVVRIYSRKTKYLLDDVNEVLFKLKNAFKYNTGVNVGQGSSRSTVNAAPQKIMLSDLSSVTLKDQVTEFDLLYQHDLDFDEDPGNSQVNTLFSQVSGVNSVNDRSVDMDQSIEIPRYRDSSMLATHDNDDDIELDFDLDQRDDNELDRSIEVGRNAPRSALEEANQSDLDLGKELENQNDGSMDFDFENPLETIDQENDLHPDLSQHEQEQAPEPASQPRERRRLVGITDTGVVKTTKRRMIVDLLEEVEHGILIQELKFNQQMQMHNLSVNFTPKSLHEDLRLRLIYELVEPKSNLIKRRRLLDSNTDESTRPEEEANGNDEEEGNETQLPLDLDLSFSGIDEGINEEERSPLPISEQVEEIQHTEKESSIQVASHLRKLSSNDPVNTSFDRLIEKDSSLQEDGRDQFPLGTVSQGVSQTKVDGKKQAAKCFFELLVLASGDCISLDQERPNEFSLGGDISIGYRDDLFHKFL